MSKAERKLARRAARVEAGHFTAQIQALPAFCSEAPYEDLSRSGMIDRKLRRMYKKVLKRA